MAGKISKIVGSKNSFFDIVMVNVDIYQCNFAYISWVNLSNVSKMILSLLHQTTQFDLTPATTVNSGKNKMKTLSAYTITWAVITACKGKNTKRDLNIMYRSGLLTISGSHFQGKPFMCHFASKESAIEKLSKVSGLNKAYNVILITDKQFGMSSFNADITAVATTKQLNESFKIN